MIALGNSIDGFGKICFTILFLSIIQTILDQVQSLIKKQLIIRKVMTTNKWN